MAEKTTPAWEKSSAHLVALFEELAPREPGVQQKKMFGWPCCFVDGKLAMGLHKQRIIFRLDDDDRAAFLKIDGAEEFAPMPGRKMKGYVALAEAVGRDRAMLARWVKRSVEFTRTLPEKGKKRTAPKAGRKTAR